MNKKSEKIKDIIKFFVFILIAIIVIALASSNDPEINELIRIIGSFCILIFLAKQFYKTSEKGKVEQLINDIGADKVIDHTISYVKKEQRLKEMIDEIAKHNPSVKSQIGDKKTDIS